MEVAIATSEGQSLLGILYQPEKTKGIIIFAHGSGSGRLSSRNQYVSQVLNESGFATLLADLLIAREAEVDEKTKEYRFNINLLTDRLVLITDWILGLPGQSVAPLGYFGASTGAAAAIAAAAAIQQQQRRNSGIKAIVSRGGRPDLAGASALDKVTPATLLLVGGSDPETIRLNQKALLQMKQVKNKRLVIVPNAGHTFEEKGTLEEAARHALSWFDLYLH